MILSSTNNRCLCLIFFEVLYTKSMTVYIELRKYYQVIVLYDVYNITDFHRIKLLASLNKNIDFCYKNIIELPFIIWS